jgi:hypothetical protein
MSGRGKGRGGRGRFEARSILSGLPRKEKKDIKNTFIDWNCYISSAKQASEFEATTEFLINYIKLNFEFGNHTATSINNQELIKTKP